MGDFDGQSVIVTGAAGGIGRVISEKFASEGASLMLADLNGEAAEELATHLKSEYGVAALTSIGDLSCQDVSRRLVDRANSAFGRLDVLVNNAGGGVIRATLEHTEETLQSTMNRNLWSALRCTLAAIPVMLESNYGRVVFIGADSVRNGLDYHAVYNAAKGGVHALAGGLSREFGSRGLTFNTVAPSAVSTPEFEKIREEKPAFANHFVSFIPMGRPAEMQEVADVVAFIASKEGSFINGQVIGVNGGSTLA